PYPGRSSAERTSRRRTGSRGVELARRGRGVAAVERRSQRHPRGGDRTHARPRRAAPGCARAAEIVKTAITASLAAVRPGVSENGIASVAYAVLAKKGSEYFSCQPRVMGGHRTGWIHTSQ